MGRLVASVGLGRIGSNRMGHNSSLSGVDSVASDSVVLEDGGLLAFLLLVHGVERDAVLPSHVEPQIVQDAGLGSFCLPSVLSERHGGSSDWLGEKSQSAPSIFGYGTRPIQRQERILVVSHGMGAPPVRP